MYSLVVCLVLVVTVNSVSSTDVLQLVSMVSVPVDGRLHSTTQDWERGLEILPGARVAVQEVNRNTDILPGYQLELVELITEGCSDNLALVQLVQQLHWEIHDHSQIRTIGLVGPLCNEATELIASIAGHPDMSLVQIAAEPSVIVRGRNNLPYLFQMLPLSKVYISVAFDLMEQFSWNKVAVLCSLEVDEYDCRTAEAFQSEAAKQDIQVLFFDAIASRTVSSFLRYLQHSGAKVIFAFVQPSTAAMVICAAHKHGLVWPDYIWILPGIDGDNLMDSAACPNDNITSTVAVAMEGVLTLELDDSPLYQSLQGEGTNGAFYASYLEELRKASSGTADEELEINSYAPVLYDAVWAFVLALNRSIQGLERDQRRNHAVAITEALVGLHFQGVLGPIEFDSNHNQIHIAVQAKRIFKGVSTCVARYDPLNATLTISNASLIEDFPDDELLEVYKLPSFPVFLTVTVVLSILFTTAMFSLYIYFHNEPEIKATSTSISLFIFLGCYLQLFSALISIIKSSSIVVHGARERVLFCNIDVWMGSVGYVLILSTLFARTLRIYRVFTHFGRTGRLCSNGMLCTLILCLVLIEAILLTLWAAVDAYHLVDITTYNRDGKPPFYETVQVCECDYLSVWAGLLFGYSSLLLLALLFLAIKTRKIQRGNFKDTKKVNTLLLSYVLTRAITITMWITFRSSSPKLSSISILVALMLTSLFCQVYLFMPKTVPPLWRHMKLRIQQDESSRDRQTRTIGTIALFNILFIKIAERQP